MAVLTLTDAQLAFGHVALLDHSDFSLEGNERVGLIGRNGTGKSSLLKIIAGKTRLDDGQLVVQQGLTTAYVEQEPQFNPDETVFEAVSSALGETRALLKEYEEVSSSFGGDDDEQLMERMQHLQTRLDATDAWSAPQRVDQMLERLSLPRDALLGSLSGGTQKRVALACALVNAPDVLLLDEPTNHLDFNSIIWLENLLREYRGTVLFITHDRSFLDHVSTRIVELDRGKLLSFPGNFSAYQARKAELLAIEEIEFAKFDKVLAQEEVWIRKGVQARRTRNEGRVRRLEALRVARSQRRDQQGQVKLDISVAEKSGKMVVELIEVSKQFGERKIVDGFSATILRGDKVGLIGPNGAGKSTLLKLMLGEITPDAGTIRQGARLQIAYFDQMRAQLNEDASLVDTISPGSDWVEINGQKKHAMSYLGEFLFSPERARSPVKSLSGGERNRLLLARLFARPANVLVLDEPTNDLDIDTLELLEVLLEDFSGTVFLVSHDRAFLDNVVTQVFVAEGEGRWQEYVGGYSDWERMRAPSSPRAAKTESKKSEPGKAEAAAAAAVASATPGAKGKKLSYREQRDLEELPRLIAQLEEEQKAIGARLGDAELYKAQPDEAQRLNQRFAQIDELLMETLEKWEAIEARAKS